LFFKSCLGAESIRSATDTVLAGSTVSIIKVADGTLYQVGQSVMINGVIRNVKSIATNDLTMNFDFPLAPSAGAVIEKSYGYKPAASGHPSFSAFAYTSSGAAIQAAAGCQVTGGSINLTSGQQAEVSFEFAGTKYFLNPIKIEATNKFIDITDANGDTVAVSLTEKVYRTPIELAEEMQNKIIAATGELFTVVYSSVTGKFTIANGSGNFSILWNTGANTLVSVGTTIGFDVLADDTGVATYTSDNALSYDVPLTPVYDGTDNIIVKKAELMIGDASENFCRKASNVTVSFETPVTDVDSICSESGVLEKLILSRAVTLNATVLMEKHEISFFDKLINNRTTQAMVNLGPLSGTGYAVGKAVNLYLGNASITQSQITGDDVVVVEIVIKGFVTTSIKDIYANFA